MKNNLAMPIFKEICFFKPFLSEGSIEFRLNSLAFVYPPSTLDKKIYSDSETYLWWDDQSQIFRILFTNEVAKEIFLSVQQLERFSNDSYVY